MKQASLQALQALSPAQKRALLTRLIRHGTADLQQQVALTSGQAAMYLLQSEEPDSDSYNIFTAIKVRGALDINRLRKAVRALSKLHPAISARCDSSLAETQLHISASPLRLEEVGVPGSSARDAAAWQAYGAEYGKRAFKLDEQLARIVLLRPRRSELHGAAEEALLIIAAHHIVVDYWSMGVLVDDLLRLYAQAEVPVASKLSSRAHVSAAHIAEQEYLASAESTAARAFWRSSLASAKAMTNLPVRRPRPAVREVKGAALRFELSAAESGALQRRARELDTSLYVLLLAGWGLMLREFCQSDDCTVGSPTTLRALPEMRSAVGYFINMLPLRLQMQDSMTLADYVAAVKSSVQAGLRRRHLPFGDIVAAGGFPRSAAITPAFQSALVVQSLPTEGLMRELIRAQARSKRSEAAAEQTNERSAESLAHDSVPDNTETSGWVKFADLELQMQEHVLQTGQFDLALEVGLIDERVLGSLKFNSAAFDAQLVKQMRAVLTEILERLCTAEAAQLKDLRLEALSSEVNWKGRAAHPAAEANTAALVFNSREYMTALARIQAAGLMCAPEAQTICLIGEYPSYALLERHFQLMPDVHLRFELRAAGAAVATKEFSLESVNSTALPQLQALAGQAYSIIGRQGQVLAAGVAGKLQVSADTTQPLTHFDGLGTVRARRIPANMIELSGGDASLKAGEFEFELNELRMAVEQHPAVAWADVRPALAADGEFDSDQLRGADVVNTSIVVEICPLAGRVAPDVHSLQQFLRERIPAYMLPSGVQEITASQLNSEEIVKRLTVCDSETEDFEEGEI